jgi:hypothetical protein
MSCMLKTTARKAIRGKLVAVKQGRFVNGTMERLGRTHALKVTGDIDRRAVALHNLRQRESTEKIAGVSRRKFKHPSN